MKQERASILLTAGLMLSALLLFLAPERLSEKLTGSIRTALKPGLLAVYWTQQQFEPVEEPDIQPELLALQQELKILKQELQLAQAESIRFQELLEHQRNFVEFPYRAEETRALVVPELVTARVLGDQSRQSWKQQKMLDTGSSAGIKESHWVLEAETPIVDLGEDHNVQPQDYVLSGKAVLGRIQKVGRWSSTLQCLTDDQFKAKARLIRKVGQNYVAGAEGLLEGTGEDRCQLTMVSREALVDVGDSVYTVADESPQQHPLLFGTIVKAELKPGALEWEIEVAPAIAQQEFTQVEILRHSINPLRMSAN